MSEEKKVYSKHPEMTELARNLSNVSRNIGNVGFSIAYPATESNIGTHERFIRFAFDEANGDYIVALSKLLDFAELSTRIDSIEQRIQLLEVMVLDHLEDSNGMQKEKVKEEVKKELKVF